MSFTPSAAGATQASIFDFGALSGLRHDVANNPSSADKQAEVARQFEAVYLQLALKRMRAATMKSGLFDSQQSEMMRSLADEQLALQLATPGIGLAQALLRQMRAQGVQPGEPGDGVVEAEAGSGIAPDDEALALRAPTRPFPRAGSTVSPELAALLRVLETNRPADRALAAQEGAPAHVVDFVAEMAGPAKAAERISGVPARLILGQAALESGWGRREIRGADGRNSYNLFGIKAGDSWHGRVVNILTTEYEDGVARKVMQPFRAYNSYAESFADYARLLGTSPRYEAVTRAADEVEAARRIQAAGYATDPRYADKLIGIMGQFRRATATPDI